MPAEVLLVVTDDALRQVLSIALTADGCAVRTAVDTSAGRAALATHQPDLLVLDGTMRLLEAPEHWAAAYAPGVPLVLLVSAWAGEITAVGPRTTLLRMPFGLSALRRALADAQSACLRR